MLKPIARRALAAQSDQRLVLLLRDGHEPAFDEIVRRYRGPLVAFAAAIAGGGNAEDVVQAALVRVHAALIADDREIRLRPWLFAIVRNGALNAVRDHPAWSELDPELHRGGETAATAEQREELEQLIDAICALPESQRRALVMREMEGVGHAEIATKLGTSATAVRGLIFRARTTLRNALGALVPLPVLRWLLEDTAAVSAAGAAGAAGSGILAGGGALGGGVLGKTAIGLTAAVVAIGAGKAVNDRRSGDDRSGSGAVAASASTGGGSDASAVGVGDGSRVEQSHRERGEDRGEAGREEREGRRDERGDDDGEGGGDDGERGDDAPEGSSPAPGDDDDRRSGGSSGRGDSVDDDEPEPDEPEVDEPEVEEPEVDEPEVDDDEPEQAATESNDDPDDADDD